MWVMKEELRTMTPTPPALRNVPIPSLPAHLQDCIVADSMPAPVPKTRTFALQAVNAARQTTISTMALSQMADQKASTLMGATFLVFSLTLGQASKGGPSVVPLLVMGAFAFISAGFAVWVVMPAIRFKKPLPTPVERGNMMFFGVISQFSEDEYIERMLDNLADDESMYRMMFRDIWQNAQVLQHKKYKLLGYAYRSFLCGLVASALVFAAQFFFRLRL